MPPTILIESLQSVRRRVRWLGVLFGAGVVVSSAVAALLVTVLIDYMLNLPPVPRLIIMLLAAAGVGFVLVEWVARPLMAKLTLGDVAGRLEEAFPEFDDRLRSTVTFIGQRDVPGSELMKERVVTEAAALAQRLDLNRAIVTTPVWYSWGSALGAVVVLLALWLAIGSAYRSAALSRLLSPFSAQPWPKKVQIELVGNVPQRVPVGQRVPVQMKLARGDRESLKATILYRYGDGPWQQELMTRGEDGTYTASLDARVAANAARGSLQVRLKAGDDLRELDPIAILPRLTVTGVHAIVTPPEYIAANAQPVTFNLAAGSAIVPAGSSVELALSFNKPLDGNQPIDLETVAADMVVPQIAWDRVTETEARGTLVAEQSLRFHVRATDVDGFRTSGIEEYDLIVRPDQPPVVQIEVPRRNEERTPVARVPLQGMVEDDYGVESLKLVVDRLGDKKHWEMDLVAQGSPASGASWVTLDGAGDRLRFRMNYEWDLAVALEGADLKPGDVLEYYLLAKDNFALNGQSHEPVASGKLRIHIVSQEQLTDSLTNELRTIATQIAEIKSSQDRTREETTALAEETAEKPALDDADRAAAERLGGQQSTAASQTKSVATKLGDVQRRIAENQSPAQELNDLAEEVKENLNRTAEGPMKSAASEIGNAQQQQQADERNQSMDRASEQQEQASDNLARALDRMSNIGSLQQTMDRIGALLQEQKDVGQQTREVGTRNIGRRPEQMSAEDRQKLAELADRQQNLSERTQAAIEDMKELADQMERTDPEAARSMEQAAQTGQQQQVSQNQRKAAENARQNQQSGAQSAQRQAELGLEMMMNQLREAERRKLEELSRKLAELQEQIATLIRRQAGHNLDNLHLQGAERIASAGEELIASLTDKAERDAGSGAQQVPQLSTAQEQTERNTRDIARSLEDVEDGAEPASRLVRAAARMERAIVNLRGQKLSDAYDPSQVEALAALEEARQVVDEQRQEVEQQRQHAQKEAIRQVYVRIKQEQEKLNTEVASIDESPRLEDGNLRREVAMRLGQLPGDQGKLEDEIRALDERLAAVGGVVYVWANKDIGDVMANVKDALGQKQTGAPTQADQQRIVAQLDAMIKNLAIKQRENRFENRQEQAGDGGQNGGSNGEQLPTEAELQLLKDLQLAINQTTKDLDAQPDRDPSRLVSLGDRQGSIREVLDQLLQQASRGQVKLGPEPDPDEQLPEEAGLEEIENQELDEELLNADADKPTDEKQLNLVGDRMARSRQRLALNNDPGRTTQLIQERIVIDLDDLIDQARQQQQQQQQARQQQQRQQQRPQQQPQQQQANAQNQGQRPQQAQDAAQQSNLNQGQEPQADLSQQIEQSAREWGQISPRARDAVIEGSREEVIEKYRRLVEDYYRGVATRTTQE